MPERITNLKVHKAKTKKPSGLTITRNGNGFVFAWKISDKDYALGQQLWYKVGSNNWVKMDLGAKESRLFTSAPEAEAKYTSSPDEGRTPPAQLAESAHAPPEALFQTRMFVPSTTTSPSPSIQPAAFAPVPLYVPSGPQAQERIRRDRHGGG